MTIDTMVIYLEKCGFKTTKKYLPERKVYEFRIEKNGVAAVGEYEYIAVMHPYSIGKMQQAFLDNLIRTWEEAHEFSASFATENPYRRVVHDMEEYIKNDIENTYEVYKVMNSRFISSISKHSIKDVIFNKPATIVFWTDGTKTVVKCQENDTFDAEVGLAMAIAKKALGNKGNYCNEIKKWTEKYVEPDYE